jgi:hypothetical protein
VENKTSSYFLVAVSNKENLNLCMKYSLAGFPNSINGIWAFLDIREGDFISFLYAARAYNLYQVIKKEAYSNAEKLPPWKPLTFQSGRTYCFPYRLYLKPVRQFNESLVRVDFAYVAENLLLRGGYARTHFQADQTTLQQASQLGELSSETTEKVEMESYETFVPKFTLNKEKIHKPEVLPIREMILQTVIRQYLQDNYLASFLQLLQISELNPESLEVLGEKALPEGHVDIFLKESVPIGKAKKIPIEVKLGKASTKDLEQLEKYKAELGSECICACLVARDFQKKTLSSAKGLNLVKYKLKMNQNVLYTVNELKDLVEFEVIR